MKIFFDFDDFFLDTEGSMIRDYFSLLKQLTGADDTVIDETFARFSGAGFVHGEVYSPGRHIEFLREVLDFDVKKANEEAQIFFTDIRKYLFDGTVEFLKTCIKDDIYLLTFGESNFQKLKVSGSGLQDFFHKVIVTAGDKSEEIERVSKEDSFSSGEIIVFADNRCGHFSGAKKRGYVTIHLKRPLDKYSKVPCEGCLYTVENYVELAEVLRKI